MSSGHATEKQCTRCGFCYPIARFKPKRSWCRWCINIDQQKRRDRIVTRKCSRCSRSYSCRNGESRFCDPCGRLIRTANIVNTPKATLICKQCGAEYQPGHLKRQFCSLACKGLASRNRPTAKRGKTFPELWRAAVRACLCCGTEFRAVKDTKRVKQAYCSHRCYLRNRRVSLVERRLADMLRARGLPIETTVSHGRWTYDIAVTGTQVLVEFDGTFWHSSPKAKERDRRKDEWCRQNGYTLVRIAEADFRRDPDGAADVILRRAEAEGLTVERDDG